MSWQPSDLIPYLPLIFQGLWVSVYVSVASFLAGSVLGLFAYFAKAGRSATLRLISSSYIEIVRKVPLPVVLRRIHSGLAPVGVNLAPGRTAVIAATNNDGAKLAATLRAG